MRRSFFFLINFLLLICVTIVYSKLALAAEATTAWRSEWEKTIKAAEEEGTVVIYMTQSLEPVFRDSFQKKFPKIKVTAVTGRGPEISQRVMSERRAEKFAVDLYISGSTSPRIFHRAKILEPIKPLLTLPEVVDTSGWYEGKHHYNDPENRYIFVFEGTPRSGDITFNTKVVNPAEIKSYWDLLAPKWKGKIVTVDPFLPGPISAAQIFFYKHADLGPEFVRRLYADTEITILRSNEQLMDWLSVGKYAFGIGVRDVRQGNFAGYAAYAIFAGIPKRRILRHCLQRHGELFHSRAASQRRESRRQLAFVSRRANGVARLRSKNWRPSRFFAGRYLQGQDQPVGPPRERRQISLARSWMDRRVTRNSRDYQESFGERRERKVTEIVHFPGRNPNYFR